LTGETGERHPNSSQQHVYPRPQRKPEPKYRYLKSGFEIVGDHKWPAKPASCSIITATW
jgi:hypothetical protein